jgi:hypothetical protein
MSRTPKRPGTVIFVAVLLFLGGGWNILSGVCGGGSLKRCLPLADTSAIY